MYLQILYKYKIWPTGWINTIDMEWMAEKKLNVHNLIKIYIGTLNKHIFNCLLNAFLKRRIYL